MRNEPTKCSSESSDLDFDFVFFILENSCPLPDVPHQAVKIEVTRYYCNLSGLLGDDRQAGQLCYNGRRLLNLDEIAKASRAG